MFDKFPGHFPQRHTSLDALWKQALIVVDANFLLNLYRYSTTTRDEILALLTEQRTRLWLPHRAADEFLENRLTVLGKQQSEYDNTIKTIKDLQSRLDNTRSHPFLSDRLTADTSKLFHRLLDELNERQNSHAERIPNDELKDRVGEIFHGRVGDPLPEAELRDLFTEGERRYRQRIPPGYKDEGKASEGTDDFFELCRKYGDLILWKQLIRKASEDQVGILFVTDDRKEDWWSQSHGKTIGPRPELLTEFRCEAEQPFHMYQVDRFLELAHSRLNEQVSTASVEEIRSIQESDREQRRSRPKPHRSPYNPDASIYSHFKSLNDEVEHCEAEIEAIQAELGHIRAEQDRLRHAAASSDRSSGFRYELEECEYREHKLMDRLEMLLRDRDRSKAEIRKIAAFLEPPTSPSESSETRHFRSRHPKF